VPHPLDGALLTGGAVYPPDRPGQLAYENRGTKQPKADARVDVETAGGGRATVQGGYAATSGIILGALGPFDLQSPSWMSYGRVQHERRAEGGGLRQLADG
jgi:hypothetical protein